MTNTVLVIDDNQANVDLMIFILNAMGLTVIPALNGPAGAAIARAQHPSLVLCDVQMPHLDGFGVLKAIRETAGMEKTPVVAITALAMNGDEQMLLDAGFDGYISKPVEFDRLKSAIEKYLPELASDVPKRSQ
jgi:CheY-like chemotaxis protein